MAIIRDINQLKPLIEAGKALQKVDQFSPQGVTGGMTDDSWSKFERIITGIDHLLDTALKVKNDSQPQAGQTGFSRPVMVNTNKAPTVIDYQAEPAKKAENNQKEDSDLMKITKQMIEFFEQHLNVCIKENPNMTLGDAIDKLDINVTQLAVLLQLFKKSKGG